MEQLDLNNVKFIPRGRLIHLNDDTYVTISRYKNPKSRTWENFTIRFNKNCMEDFKFTSKTTFLIGTDNLNNIVLKLCEPEEFGCYSMNSGGAICINAILKIPSLKDALLKMFTDCKSVRTKLEQYPDHPDIFVFNLNKCKRAT